MGGSYKASEPVLISDALFLPEEESQRVYSHAEDNHRLNWPMTNLRKTNRFARYSRIIVMADHWPF